MTNHTIQQQITKHSNINILPEKLEGANDKNNRIIAHWTNKFFPPPGTKMVCWRISFCYKRWTAHSTNQQILNCIIVLLIL